MTFPTSRTRRALIRAELAKVARIPDPEAAERLGIARGEARENARLGRIMAAAGGQLDLALMLAFETRASSAEAARVLAVADTVRATRSEHRTDAGMFAHLNTPEARDALVKWQARRASRR